MSRYGTSRFSLLGFVVALATVGVGAATGLRFVPTYGTYLGMLAGGLLAGLVLEQRPTVEAGVAAVVAGLGVLVAGAIPGKGVVEAVLTLAAVEPVTALVSVALSFVVGAFGGHFGDDLRDGLTEPLPEPAPAATGGRSVDRETTNHTAASDSTDEERVDVDERTPASQDDAGETTETDDDVAYELE